MDESHFDGRMMKLRYARAPKGERIFVENSGDLKSTLSISILTSLVHENPIYIQYRDQSNSQEHFLFLFGLQLSLDILPRVISFYATMRLFIMDPIRFRWLKIYSFLSALSLLDSQFTVLSSIRVSWSLTT